MCDLSFFLLEVRAARGLCIRFYWLSQLRLANLRGTLGLEWSVRRFLAEKKSGEWSLATKLLAKDDISACGMPNYD